MNLLRILWRIWYYVVIAVVIFALFPIILILALRADWHRHFFWWARLWGKVVVAAMGFRLDKRIEEKIDWKGPFIIAANHTSEIDIMTTLAIAKGRWLFIGKKELTKFPVFGYFYKKTNILVDRSSPRSRRDVYRRAQEKIKEGFGICIYPEGGIPDPSWQLAPFKPGAFRMAIETGIPIIPITFVDNKRRFPDPWTQGAPGKLRCVIHKPISTEGLDEEDAHRLRQDVYKIMSKTLEEYGVEGKTQNQ